MVFPVVGGDGKPTGYEIDNSLRFNDDDDAVLDRGSISGTLSKAHTFSLWVKRSNLDDARHVLAMMGDGSGNISLIEFNANSIRYFGDGAGNYAPQTTAKYRDVSAWYHIVVKVDTTQSSASDRLKIYVNGTEQAYSGTPPPQNHQADMDECTIGFNPGDEFDGYMAEFHFLDGVAYDPTYFAETNDNGVWIPKKYTGGNYGTFGFYLQFQQTGTSANSSGMGADTSGNDNHFSATNLNAYDVVPDSPTNNYCVLNSVDKDGHTNAEGSLEVSGNVIYGMQRGTIGATSGKWYFEARLNTYQGDTAIALANEDENIFTRFSGETTNSVGYLADNRFFYNSGATNYSSLSAGNIFQIAFDADTGKIWIGKNNTWQNSGDPANGTGSVQTVSWNFFLPAARTVGSGVLHYNFGQDSSFGGHSTAQNNADGNGYGDFYYAPPTGFFALNTKNLAEYG